MTSAAEDRDPLVRSVAGRLAKHVGLDPSSVSAEAVRGVLDRLLSTGLAPEGILGGSTTSGSEVHGSFVDAVCVGETYFFRHAEQLDAMKELVSARSLRRPLRVWSAGCSTGEEAYSVARCLLEVSPGGVEVLGTDVAPAHVRAARRGIYGAWSLRGAHPRIGPWLESLGDRYRVTDAARASVRFEVHNVLEPPPGHTFDVVLCRNVLVYFTAEAAARACAHLAAAVSPRGVLVLGPVDVTERPPGLEPHGTCSGSIFTKGDPEDRAGDVSSLRREPSRLPSPRCDAAPRGDPAGRADGPASASRPSPDRQRRVPEGCPLGLAASVRHHLDALSRVEQGDDAGAEALLDRTRPSYVPGLLERALLRGRQGRSAAAARLMEEVLLRTSALPGGDVIEGPAPLTVEFYRSAASAFLARRAARHLR